MSSLSAGTVSLPVKPDTRGFGAILGKEILGATSEVGKLASEAFAKTFGATTAVKLKEQNKVILASAADVERASMRVKTAQEAEALSAGRLRIADAQLAEARVKYAEGDSHLLKAEERLAVAQKTHAANSAAVETATTRLVPVQGRLTDEQRKLATMTERSHTALGRLGTGFRAVGSGIASMAGPLAIAGGIATVLGAEAVKAAANFETATTRLVTDAGESEKNLSMIRDGILNISAATGTGAAEIAKGMYLVESAGYHGAAGLKVMQAAAEGAKIGGADLATVSDALTTAMTDYAVPAAHAADVTSKLVATVSVGKTTMEQLAGSLHSVLPAAEAAHLSLAQVLGAVGTMTAEGISAQQATENLNHAILSLQNPTAVQTKAMAAMGLSSLDVAKNLGQRGLTGTLETLEQAIMKHMGRGGLVLQNTFNQSKLAAASAEKMLQGLPPSLQKLGRAYLDNQITQKDWTKALKEQPALTSGMGKQFATVAKNAHGFSDALKSGQGPAATFVSQLAKMTGGQTGLQVALHLSGTHADTFAKNVKKVSDASKTASGHVHDWDVIQKTFNQKMSVAAAAFDKAGIKIGTALMPAIAKLLPELPKIAKDVEKAAPAIAKVVDAIVKMIDEFRHGAAQWDDAERNVKKGIRDLRGEFSHGAKQIGDAWNSTAKSWKHGAAQWDDAERNVKKGIRDLHTSFGHGATQISDAWNGTVKNFRHGATQIGSATSDMTKKFGHGADQMKTFFDGVVKNFQHGGAQIGTFFGQIVSGASDTWKKVTGAFDHGRRQIIGFFSDAGTWLYNAGAKIVGGLADGISGAVGKATRAVSGVLSAVKRFLPNSPAKEGPFSGKGWSLYSGHAIGEDLAVGLSAKTNRVRSAARGMMSAATLTAPSVASLPGSGVASLAPSRGQSGAVQVVMPDTITVRDAKGFVATMDVVAADHVARYDLSRQLVSAR